MKLLLAAAAAVAALSAASVASAAIILQDNFNSQPADDLVWGGDSVFTPTSPPGSVDLIGVGGIFDVDPGHGSYIDMDGTTGFGNDPAGQITSNLFIPAGAYKLSFFIGGNARGAPSRTTNVTLGAFSQDFTFAASDPLALHTITFSTAIGGHLIFTEKGPSNQKGNILDDVLLESQPKVGQPGGIPEPSSWAMMIAGFGAAGAMIRRRRAMVKALA